MGTQVEGTVLVAAIPSLATYMSGAKHVSLSGNVPWAASYGRELVEVVKHHAENDPRSLQKHLGPSEIGQPCDRQVVGKLVGFGKTNHTASIWPSFMGRAGHAAMEKVFGELENQRLCRERWIAERKVTPHPSHQGTSDLYDADTFTVVDHKFLGESSMARIRSHEGPPIWYQFQLKLYARGYRNLGLRVDRILIIAWPRTGGDIEGAYAWGHVLTADDDALLEQLFARMAWREQVAEQVRQGQLGLTDIPAVPDEESCYFCPFYRPQSRKDNGPGCPGHAA
jgi:hypothetical protein